MREASQIGGVDCLVVDTTLRAALAEMPAPVDDGAVETAELRVQLRGHYPIERGVPQLGSRRQTTLRAEGAAPEGARFVLEATTEASRRVTELRRGSD